MTPLKIVTIYRVENNNKEGMYGGSDVPCSWEMVESKTHPSPYEDDKIKPFWDRHSKDLQFGFSSIQQLRFWIYKKEWREQLDASGFHISVIIAKGAHGDTQSVFLPTTRKDIKTISLLDI